MSIDERDLESRLRASLVAWAEEAPRPVPAWAPPVRRAAWLGRRAWLSVAVPGALAVAVAVVVVVGNRDDAAVVVADRGDLVVADIPVGELRGVRVVAAGEGAVFVNSENDGRLYRIDPATNEVSGGVEVTTEAVAVGEGAVFAVVGDGPPRLARLDPDTLVIEGTVELPGEPLGVKLVEGLVWVPLAEGTLLRFDPATLTGTDPVPFDPVPAFLASGPAGVWQSRLGTGTVAHIDPDTGVVTDTVTIEGEVRGIAVGDGDIWVTDIANDRVVRIDARSGEVIADIPAGSHPGGMVIGDDRVWVTSFDDGTLIEIDATTNMVTAVVPVGYRPGGVVLTSGSLWVAVHQEAKVVRLDPGLLASRAVHAVALDERSVDLGGRSLFLRCMGSGDTTVILEADTGTTNSAWLFVQYGLQHTTRVCSYDRAGVGRSDGGPQPRTAERIAADLHQALTAAELPGRYVLVGHGYGGLYARRFAADHPDEVIGVVLVDALTPTWIDEVTPLLTPDERADLEAGFEDPEFEGTRESFTQVTGDLGDRLLVVLAHDPVESGFAPSVESLWQRHQRDQARLSTRGRFVTATGSNHEIPLNRPDAIVGAVQAVLDQARS